MKAINFLSAVCLIIGTSSALAETITYQGSISSRQQCQDKLPQLFGTKDSCTKLAAPKNRTCIVQIEFDQSGTARRSAFQIPGILEVADGTSDTQSFDGVTRNTADFVNSPARFHTLNFSDGNINSGELKMRGTPSEGGKVLLAAKFYLNHRFDNSARTWTEYTCLGMKAIQRN